MAAKKAGGGGRISQALDFTVGRPRYSVKSIGGERPTTTKPSGVAIPGVVIGKSKRKKPAAKKASGEQ
jgi:hypothetical protein